MAYVYIKQFDRHGDEMTVAHVGDIVTKGFGEKPEFKVISISNDPAYARLYVLKNMETGDEVKVRGSGSMDYVIK